MNVISKLIKRNKSFVADSFPAGLKIIPTLKTMIIGCVDSRVDPSEILGLRLGEAVVMRNVGGRVDPAILLNMSILGTVTKASGGEVGTGWNLIVLHHTDCGIKPCFVHAPELLAKQFGVPLAQLSELGIDDPYKSVKIDVAALKSNPKLAGSFVVTGMVYDVETGVVETVVPSAPLRDET
jgi:carbonic anhydrase